MMIHLYNSDSNELLGPITDHELQLMVDAFEEESATDQDYYITTDTIDIIADGSATDHLLELLRKAVGTSEGVTVRWERS